MVLLTLATGVTTIVLRTVSVLVVDTVAGVCRQEQTRAISEAGRDKTLEKMLALTDGIACLLATTVVATTAGVVVMVTVLRSLVSIFMRYFLELCSQLTL